MRLFRSQADRFRAVHFSPSLRLLRAALSRMNPAVGAVPLLFPLLSFCCPLLLLGALSSTARYYCPLPLPLSLYRSPLPLYRSPQSPSTQHALSVRSERPFQASVSSVLSKRPVLCCDRSGHAEASLRPRERANSCPSSEEAKRAYRVFSLNGAR